MSSFKNLYEAYVILSGYDFSSVYENAAQIMNSYETKFLGNHKVKASSYDVPSVSAIIHVYNLRSYELDTLQDYLDDYCLNYSIHFKKL